MPFLRGVYNAIQKIGAAKRSLRALLICGIVSSLLYVSMDILAGMFWEGYSFTSQTISELSAIGAPTRPQWVPLGFVYDALLIAFGLDVWIIDGDQRRALHLIGGLLIGIAAVGLVVTPLPTHMRGAEMTFTDTMHAVLFGVIVPLSILLSRTSSCCIQRKLVQPLLDWNARDICRRRSFDRLGCSSACSTTGYTRAWGHGAHSRLWFHAMSAVLAMILLREERGPGFTTSPH